MGFPRLDDIERREKADLTLAWVVQAALAVGVIFLAFTVVF
jgi:hypothetical protein